MGRLARVYVWNGTSWVDIGSARGITVTSEEQTGDRDVFGRTPSYTANVTAEVILMQNTEVEFKEALSEENEVSVFLSNKPNPTLPANPNASTTEGIILKNARVQVSGTLDLGGGQSAVTLRFTLRKYPSEIINML